MAIIKTLPSLCRCFIVSDGDPRIWSWVRHIELNHRRRRAAHRRGWRSHHLLTFRSSSMSLSPDTVGALRNDYRACSIFEAMFSWLHERLAPERGDDSSTLLFPFVHQSIPCVPQDHCRWRDSVRTPKARLPFGRNWLALNGIF